MHSMNSAKPIQVGNLDLAKAMQEKRRSNAAGTHDSRPHRQRSRADSKRAAVRDQRD
jgi:hypothetical protein